MAMGDEYYCPKCQLRFDYVKADYLFQIPRCKCGYLPKPKAIMLTGEEPLVLVGDEYRLVTPPPSPTLSTDKTA